MQVNMRQKNCDREQPDNHAFSKEIVVNHFNEDSAREFRMQVLHHAMLGGPDLPIIIYIDSYGGDADSLASMLETMDEVPNAFITVAIGKAVSCGAILLSHGDYRFCGRYARVMIHEVKSGAYGDIDDLKNDVKETERLNEVFMDLLAKNCHLPGFKELKEKMRAHDGGDMWMGPEAALAFGIVDFVGMPKLLPVIQYQCAVLPPKAPRREITPEIKKMMIGKAPCPATEQELAAEEAQLEADLEMLLAAHAAPKKTTKKKKVAQKAKKNKKK